MTTPTSWPSGQTARGRPDWAASRGPAATDRGATVTLMQYDADAVAPHAAVNRATYSVPANRVAIVQALYLRVRRAAVATTAGLVRATALLEPSGVTAREVAAAEIADNAADSRDRTTLGPHALLLAGDGLILRTADPSTGGTVDYRLTAEIVEYDG